MSAGIASVNGMDLAYETFGDRGRPAVVLVMGLGTQMIAWPDSFCGLLADTGFHVVRFDNRDVGGSTVVQAAQTSIPKVLMRREEPPYQIADMADDTVGLFDALGLERVHLVGASMGGFISQTVALRNPERVDTLTLMMTSTGSRLVGQPKPSLAMVLLKRRDIATRDAAVAATMEVLDKIASPAYPFDSAAIRVLVERSYDRGFNPAGRIRHLAASIAQPNRTKALRRLDIPTLVMHGLADELVRPSGGLALARNIPRAKFVGYAGMGHDLPQPLLPSMAAEIERLAAIPRE